MTDKQTRSDKAKTQLKDFLVHVNLMNIAEHGRQNTKEKRQEN